ncbi:MAG: hypothetical protein ACI8W7_001458 [Gammaproteobacteria bacterium]|jgi:hypothetical protein
MSSNLNLTIAGARLQFHGSNGLHLVPTEFEYPPFLGEHAFDRIVTVDVSIADGAAPAADQVLFDSADGWLLMRHDDTYCARMPVRSADGSYGAQDLWRLSWQQPLRHAYAHVHSDLVQDCAVRHFAQYPLDQIMLTTLLASEGALLVHACGGVTLAGGIAFAGVSGAGKSTLTRLLGDAPRSRFFSDDRLFIRRNDGLDGAVNTRPSEARYQLHGTPWAGDAYVARNEHTTLDALCFLTQANTTRLVELTATRALERLLPVATLPWFDAHTIGHALDACAALVENVPCYELLFRPDRAQIEQVLAELCDA